MVTKKRGRYEVSDKGKMIHELDKHLHLKGPNKGPKLAKKKAQRDVVFQQILASSNQNNRPTYENPSTQNKRTSTKKTTALKNAECNICKIKFTKQGLTRHRNSCQAKATTKKKLQ